MSNQVRVQLGIEANVNSALHELQRLKAELNGLATGTGLGKELPITPQIRQAMQAAAQLQTSLEMAVNVDTGKLNLTKFNNSLKNSGQTLADYARQMQALGPAGTSAFMNLTKSIVSAEVPVISLNKRLKEMGVTLKNTIRWQISSSIIQGFTGAIQEAFGYAKNLNRSLNDIRIVTGQNVDQMAKFAVEANKAARALSTTTNEYTKASLIYFQQGEIKYFCEKSKIFSQII